MDGHLGVLNEQFLIKVTWDSLQPGWEYSRGGGSSPSGKPPLTGAARKGRRPEREKTRKGEDPKGESFVDCQLGSLPTSTHCVMVASWARLCFLMGQFASFKHGPLWVLILDENWSARHELGSLQLRCALLAAG